MDGRILEATRLWTLAVPKVSAFISSLVRNFQDRDDILQETAVAVMESFDRYDPGRSFDGWAIGIARNQALLFLRQRGRVRMIFDTEVLDSLENAFGNSSYLDRRFELLSECLGSLDSESRELCVLRYERDMKPAEIGSAKGISANSVAKSLQRIRDRLRACMERKVRLAEVVG
jgi:RNA polymerase sigma-70 factor, ECF subfamily